MDIFQFYADETPGIRCRRRQKVTGEIARRPQGHWIASQIEMDFFLTTGPDHGANCFSTTGRTQKSPGVFERTR